MREESPTPRDTRIRHLRKETTKEIAIKVVLVLHFIGLSLLLGGALYQVREKAKNIVRPMLDGAYTQLLTGIILLGLLHASHKATEPAINDAWFGVKLLIAP
jgi:putative copper export protein